MTADDLERMNTIADKAVEQTATLHELREFNQLLSEWEQVSTIDLRENNFIDLPDAKKY